MSHRDARNDYIALRNDAEAIALVRAEQRALRMKLLFNPDQAYELNSSTVNGQTFSGKNAITNKERLKRLDLIVAQVDAGRALNTDTRAIF